MTREPDPWAGSWHEKVANEPIHLCRVCVDVEVSSAGETCAACLYEEEGPAVNDERPWHDCHSDEETP